MLKFYVTISIAWFFLLIMVILNALLREKYYKNKIGDLRAHQLSSMIFILIIFATAYAMLNFLGLEYTFKDLIIAGIIWFSATITFEFIFGHYIMKHSWETLFQDYNILNGRVWILVLIAELIGPILMSKI